MEELSPGFGWQCTTSISPSALPKVSGVYIYGSVERVLGLPISITCQYVGKANNLASRIAQHDVRREENPLLRKWLRTEANAELWFAVVPSQKLDVLEKSLIRSLKPALNRIQYNK